MAALARQVGVSHGSAHKAVTKTMRLKKRPARWVPHLLTVPQQARRLQVSRAILHNFRRDPQLHRRMITGDESWFHVYDPQSHRQSLQWCASGDTRPRIPRRERSIIKVMMVVFFDCKGIILMEFVPDGHGITAARYLGIMRHLRNAIRRRRPTLWRRNSWILHHDSAPAHRARRVANFFETTATRLQPHPPTPLTLRLRITGCLSTSRRISGVRDSTMSTISSTRVTLSWGKSLRSSLELLSDGTEDAFKPVSTTKAITLSNAADIHRTVWFLTPSVQKHTKISLTDDPELGVAQVSDKNVAVCAITHWQVPESLSSFVENVQ